MRNPCFLGTEKSDSATLASFRRYRTCRIRHDGHMHAGHALCNVCRWYGRRRRTSISYPPPLPSQKRDIFSCTTYTFSMVYHCERSSGSSGLHSSGMLADRHHRDEKDQLEALIRLRYGDCGSGCRAWGDASARAPWAADWSDERPCRICNLSRLLCSSSPTRSQDHLQKGSWSTKNGRRKSLTILTRASRWSKVGEIACDLGDPGSDDGLDL